MANLDSRSKRASSVGILTPWLLTPVFPDATIAQGDRQHIAWSYSGILAAAASALAEVYGAHRYRYPPHRRAFVVPPHTRTFTVPKRRRDS